MGHASEGLAGVKGNGTNGVPSATEPVLAPGSQHQAERALGELALTSCSPSPGISCAWNTFRNSLFCNIPGG